MLNTMIVPTNKVEGDITSCKIENQVLCVEKKSVLSFKQTTTYVSYDVCSKSIIQEYTIPEFTTFGFVMILFGLFVIGCIVNGIVHR